MKAKGIIKFILAIAVTAFFAWIAVCGIGENGWGSASQVRLGLDLAGGVSITYATVKEDPTADEMADTVYKMQKRAESFSTESEVYPEGTNRITVAIPDVTDADAVLVDLGDAGNIYFVYGMSDKGIKNIEMAYDAEHGEYTYELLLPMEEIIDNGDVVIDGSHVATAEANVYQDNLKGAQYVVVLHLNELGRQRFADASKYCYGYYNSNLEDAFYRNKIAIVYDGAVVSAPQVAAIIDDGEATISGSNDITEAKQLATTIRIGALPLELKVLRYYVEGAKLGAEALESSLIAGAIGFLLIIIFMIVLYRIPGISASIALIFYVALMVISLNIFGVTLTLPGVAGIILSIGMAVDANVIIFTRIKEELASGKTVRSGIKLGFSKALSAIIDGNVTTIIAAVVLYIMGSGTVKGFAQTLGIGIALSMITALFVTKFILNSMYEMGLRGIKCFGIKKPVKAKAFTANFRKFGIMAGTVIAAGIIMVIVNCVTIGAPFNYGLDFAGGTATSVTFDTTPDASIRPEMEALVSDSIGMNAEIAIAASENMVTIKTKELSTEQRAALTDALTARYGMEKEMITTTSVGSAVSSEMKKDALTAVIVATICMLIYIWLRFRNFSFAASAVLALIHDVLVVLAVYAFLHSFISVGNTFIACILTIVGYSINATIVIFDRIRENNAEVAFKMTPAQIVDMSVTQTLSRSINTSLTTFLAIAVLAVMGVSSVREFAIPLIAGIVCGAFSSVCLTGNLWNVLQRYFKKSETEGN